VNVVCVVDPKNNNKQLQNAANISYDPKEGRYDLVFLNQDPKSLSPTKHKSESAIEPAREVARRNRAKPPTKKEEVIDLSKYGDDPDPALMTSPEKRKYREVLYEKSREVIKRVDAAMKYCQKTHELVKLGLEDTQKIIQHHKDETARREAGIKQLVAQYQTEAKPKTPIIVEPNLNKRMEQKR